MLNKEILLCGGTRGPMVYILQQPSPNQSAKNEPCTIELTYADGSKEKVTTEVGVPIEKDTPVSKIYIRATTRGIFSEIELENFTHGFGLVWTPTDSSKPVKLIFCYVNNSGGWN